MTVSPLSRPRVTPSPTSRAHNRPAPSIRSIARRQAMVQWSKRLLPVLALLLLGSVALWPEIVRQGNLNNLANRHGIATDLQAGRLLNVRYRGIDARSRPYTITARQAEQDGPERVNLVEPKADVTGENGAWTYVESAAGVYMQHAGLLDLSNKVTIYRDDGITMTTQAATMDLKQGAGAGDQPTHAEGPFGTLDAQGFALVDKGAIIQFQGASRLLLNGSHQ